MTQPKPQPGILDIELYVGGKSTVQGVQDILKLSSNENPNGPPISAQQALVAAAPLMHRYPDPDHSGLRSALAKLHGLSINKIICGCGSDELISFLCQAYSGPGVEVIHTSHGFLMYKLYAMAAGATVVPVAETERYVDVDAILAAVTSRTGIIFVANPGNPTGTKIPDTDIVRLIASTPKDVLIVLDGAYADYVEGWDGGAGFVERHSNVVMLRTLSKMYGLGGLRVGWGYGPQHVIDVLNRVRGPFNLSAPALIAGEAAVRDLNFVTTHRAQNNLARAWLATELAALGVASDPSEANFILARFVDKNHAEACDDYLQTIGILVRRVRSYDLAHALRITVPDMAGCVRVVSGVKAFLEQVE
jgi:histidinol-phosphate aminotransferase